MHDKNSKPLKSVEDKPDKDQVLHLVETHVSAAVELLKSLGPDYEKLGWLLEDALAYFDQETDTAQVCKTLSQLIQEEEEESKRQTG